MCVSEDEDAFQDITKQKVLNTNNLWIRLDKLKKLIDDTSGGYIPLPIIKNLKCVNPQDTGSQMGFHLETAMGAGIEYFKGASALVVPRSRFIPVKKCSDLMLLRSDAYLIDNNFTTALNPKCKGIAPIINLNSRKYKYLIKFEQAIRNGIPSLKKCKSLTINGYVHMGGLTSFIGDVTITKNSHDIKKIRKGKIVDTNIDVTTKCAGCSIS